MRKERFSFIWGVFSGFSKNTALEEILKHDLPFTDGYVGFWVDNVSIQHSLADIGIVAWDSSLTLFISKVEDLVRKFRCSYPLSDDLSARNTKANSEIANIEELLIKELVKRNIDKQNRKPNKLINEKSPYLLQHAYNPVNWNPWGEEAFAKAKAEDKPIFLSIGYSTCHW